MKYCLLLVVFYIHYTSYSQSTNFSVRVSEEVRKGLSSYSKDTTISLNILFDTTLYPQAVVEIWQAEGLRPVGYKIVILSKPSDIKVPLSYKAKSPRQYLKIRIAESTLPFGEPLTYGNAYIDSIAIQSGMYYKSFWNKGIAMRCMYSVEGKNVPSDQVTFVVHSSDSIRGNTIFYSKEQYLATISVKNNGAAYQFWMCIPSKSNQQTLDVVVYPNAMTKLKERFGIAKLDQIKELSEEQRASIRKAFPEYSPIVDPKVDFRMLGASNMSHIILYTMMDGSGGEKYIGINSCK